MTVSIVVPVFNVADYLRRGIDSILSQSFRDFELILVDDGSTDDSGNICDEYVAKDNRIRVVHKTNGGVSSARNAGLDLALGEWVYFPDPDDELYPDCLMTLASGISEDVDVVMGGYEVVRLDGTHVRSESYSSQPVFLDKSQSLRPLFLPYSPVFGYVGFVCLRLFRMDVIKEHHLRFDTSVTIREATLFTATYLCLSRGTTCYFEKPIYIYCYRESGAIMSLSKRFNRKYLTSFDANVKILRLIIKTGDITPDVVQSAKEELIDRYRKIKRMLAKFGIKNDKIMRSLRIKCIRELGIPFVVGYCFSWSKNKMRKLWGR